MGLAQREIEAAGISTVSLTVHLAWKGVPPRRGDHSDGSKRHEGYSSLFLYGKERTAETGEALLRAFGLRRDLPGD